MFDNANSQNRERNLPKTWFCSVQNALFDEKARLRTTNKACLHRKRNLFRLQKSLDYTTNKACFPHYSHDPRHDHSAKQHGNHSKPAHYHKPSIFKQDLPRHRFLPGTTILSNQKPTFQSKYKTRKPRKTALSAPHTRLLEAQTRQKAGPTLKASVAFSCKGFGITQSFSYFSIGYSKFFHNFAEIICTK